MLVSHDWRLLEKLATRIIAIKQEEVQVFDGSYQEYKQHERHEQRDLLAEQKLLVETKISEVLSRLSIDPSDELEKEFQALLAQKRKLEKDMSLD